MSWRKTLLNWQMEFEETPLEVLKKYYRKNPYSEEEQDFTTPFYQFDIEDMPLQELLQLNLVSDEDWFGNADHIDIAFVKREFPNKEIRVGGTVTVDKGKIEVVLDILDITPMSAAAARTFGWDEADEFGRNGRGGFWFWWD